ncbi:dihydrofolate reductase family protein [Sphingopyxis sp.]|uniref:dihydrofolate reductase family protein n=1 Tax=Sphingopyxis sp. TaxID=1908224 RepID=UPI003D6C7425
MTAPLFAQISVSLDGFIEDRDKNIDWMTEDASVDALHTRTLNEIGGMIFGRVAHATIAGFWIDAAAGRMEMSPDLAQQSERMTALPKYVLTHGRETGDWVQSRAIALGDIARLKAEATKPVAVFAGAGAIQSALAAGLIDELRLIRYPVVLGGGTPLFADDGTRRTLASIDRETFASGATLERFRI